MRKHTRAPYRCLPLLAGVLGVLSLTGCQTVRMNVPESLAGSERMQVSGRQGFMIKQTLRFGPYQTTRVERSWTRGRGIEIRPVEASRRDQRYAFILRDGETDLVEVRCEVRLSRLTIEVGSVDVSPADRSGLRCALTPPDGGLDDSWRLELSESHDRPLAGTLVGSRGALEVRGTNRIDGALPLGSTSGYRIDQGGRTLAAVEVINRGAVWMDGDLGADERVVVAATAAALLLLEDLRATAGV
jgi:hypothetical protein